jgi:hypothetical protein
VTVSFGVMADLGGLTCFCLVLDRHRALDLFMHFVVMSVARLQ